MKYHIIGAGISGLSLGYFLKNTGNDVQIYEEKPYSGGLIATECQSEGFIQHGPHLMRRTDVVVSLFNALGVDFSDSQTNKKFIAKADDYTMQKLNIGISDMLNTIIHLFYNRKDEYNSLYDFAVHHYGKFVAENIIQSIANGIYAVDITNLDYKIALQKLYFTERKAVYRIARNLHNMKSSSLIAPVKGFQDLINKLTERLSENIVYNTEVNDIQQSTGNVFITVPVLSALKLQNLPQGSKNLLEEISYSSLNVTTVFTNKQIKFRGVGVLTNAHTGILGILCNSDAFPNRANPGLHSYSVFSKNIAENNIAAFFLKAFDVIVIKSYFNTYQHCIPVYNSAVQRFIQYNNSLSGNIKFFSNYTGQIAINDIILQAKKIADA